MTNKYFKTQTEGKTELILLAHICDKLNELIDEVASVNARLALYSLKDVLVENYSRNNESTNVEQI